MAYLGVPQSKLENLTTNVQIVNLSASFDGTTVTFNLQDSRGDAVYAVHERALLVTLGGITQKPGVDYTTSGTTITFTTAPVSNLTIEIRKFYGVQRIIGVNDGVISPVKLTTGGPVWNSSGNVTISGDLNVTGAFNSGGNGLFWEDNEKANFGSDNDLEIYHSGVNSFIRDTGTGSLFIEGTDLTLRAADSTTRYLVANQSNGDVSLFFGNNKKFETTAQGISVTGDINGTGNFILTSTNIGSTAAPEIDLFRDSTSPADADYIGQIKFTGKQDSGGTVNYAKITGKILDASNGTEDGILEFMLRKGGSNNIAARFRSDSLQLLNGTGLTVDGNISLDDSSGSTDGRIILGTGDDLQIYHTGNHSRIADTGTGKLQLGSDTQVEILNGAFSIPLAQFNPGGSVVLRHNNSTKFETTSTGAKVTGALEVTQEYPSIRPILDLNFAATKTLDHRITFTRDSIGTYIGENGLVKYASNNVPRFDHDPTTGESLGLLIEESGTNTKTNSQVFTSGWNRTGIEAVTQNTSIVTPSGSTDSTGVGVLTESSGGTVHQFYAASSSQVTKYITYSIFAKPNGRSHIQLVTSGFVHNLADGTTSGSASGEFISAKTEKLSNGWCRCSVVRNHSNSYDQFNVKLSNGSSTSYSGDGSSGVYIWGVQQEDKAFLTSYIPTSGSTATRAQDTPLITGTNFTDFYNQSEGTLVLSADIGYLATSNQVAVAFEDTSNVSANFIAMGYNTGGGGSGHVGAWYNSSGTTSAFASHNIGITINTEFKQAYAYKLNDFSSVANGSTPITDTSGGLTSLIDRVRFGIYHYDGMTSGHIRQFKYYNKRLPNAQLQGLTQQ